MLQCSSVATTSASIFLLRPSIFYSYQVHARRDTFLSSSAQAHGGIASLFCRSFPKWPPEPIDLAAVSLMQLENAEPTAKEELRGDLCLEAMACDEDFEIEVLNVGGKKNRRMIRSRVRVDADLSAVWRVLTDYEGLPTFIPSLAVCQLLEKRGNFARLYQVGEQYLALGLKFNAKGILECYEGDLEDTTTARRRDIEFRMVEGDFQTFEGRWSIEQVVDEACDDGEISTEREYRTTLSYVVELEPKLWLPVRLLEGRVRREVKINILCIRDQAQRLQKLASEVLASG